MLNTDWTPLALTAPQHILHHFALQHFLILDYVCMSVFFYLSVCLCLSVLYLYILYYVIRRPALMELFLLEFW